MNNKTILNKKQVKAFLEVISDDDSRPALTVAKIDIYNDNVVLVATNSYILAAIRLSDDMLPEVGKFLTREALTKWYKLANIKDALTEGELVEMAITEELAALKYPEWQKIVPAPVGPDEDITPYLTRTIGFNVAYVDTMTRLAFPFNKTYNGNLSWELHGRLGAMVSTHDGNLYIVMPTKG